MLTRRDLLAAAAGAAAAGGAFAQAFPTRPMKIVVPFPPGGTGDAQARLIGEYMARTLGQSMVVENKPGAGSVIGAAAVAQAPADGYTLLLMSNSFVINNKLRGATLPYAGMKAFEPVACLTNSPQMIAVNATRPWKNFREWVEAAKAKPDTLSYATFGPATTQHIAGEMLVRPLGMKMTYVPFPGGAPAVNAAVAGHADAVLANVNEIQPHVQSGKLRALAVATAQRLPSMPDVPTVAEAGLPGYEAAAWFGLLAPAGTPRDAIARLSRAALAALGDAEVRKRLEGVGLDPYPMDAAQFAAHINDQFTRYSKVIDEAGIKA
ncbi:MAG TPA: tripartite tricarboxylate transporter substrate binding protein [Ramlibacter sp.]|jgi:tripartite-type tricarboxylate transporter receptor subunit TctC|nr:tripartite tricarboxylate transporter substrate binding protein [Ramlibacter sp.]